MAYSVLGGAEGDYGTIAAQPAVRRVAAAHQTTAANVAMQWVSQGLGMPLVVISSSAVHLAENLQLFSPPWGALSTSEVDELSAVRSPAGRPSHWGDCRDSTLAEKRVS